MEKSYCRPVLILLVLLTPIPFSGCDCRDRRGSAIEALTAGGGEIDEARRQKEIFDSSLETLDSLENAPCLPETPGGEKLIQIADRLNKWIQARQPDEHWKPDETFLAVEAATSTTAGTARELVRMLHLLQEKEVPDDDGRPVAASESLEAERKRITELLQRLETELTHLAKLVETADIAVFSNYVVELRKKFANLDAVRNLNAAGIRAFAKQLDTETEQFVNVADNLDKFTAELRVDGLFIQAADVDHLKQSLWMRNVSQWAQGDKQDHLERARNLFDWTVCNIDLKDRSVSYELQGQGGRVTLPQQYPWQTLLLGHGTVWDRAWVFIELLRQQRLDACLLSVPHPEQPEIPLVWAVGVLLDGEIYLFLPVFGMPLPGLSGPALAENGSLSFEDTATLSQVLRDDSLLRRLDMSEQDRFPVTAEMLRKTTVYLLGTPESVSMRMKVFEEELSGEQNMVLYTDIGEQRRRFAAVDGIDSVDVWRYPFRTKFEQLLLVRVTNNLMATFLIPNPKRQHFPLWAGRILYFKGKITGQESAMTNYQEARIPDREIMEYRSHAAFRNDPLREQMYRLVSANASYWLGLASFEIDSLDAAKDCFTGLETSQYNAWQSSVQYMLGRLAERENQYDQAVRRFRLAAEGPSTLGHAVRAKWLRELSEKTGM